VIVKSASSDVGSTVGVVGDLYTFSAELWKYQGADPWHFISLPPEVSDDICAKFGAHASGFGSIKVEAVVASTKWSTSLFPDKGRGTYLLPVKKALRVAEELEEGDVATVSLRI